MSNYTQNTNFAAKDSLPTGNPEKTILGADIDGEFSEIATMSATKIDLPGSPSEGDVLTYTSGAWASSAPVSTVPQGYRYGCELSNGTDAAHDIDITTGTLRDVDNDGAMILTSALTKQIDVNWTEGDDAGGFPSGLSLSADTWYHVFVIGKADGTVDAGFDTSPFCSNLLSDASGYVYYRRVGSVLTDATSNILGFFQYGDTFYWKSPIEDLDSQVITTTQSLITLSVPPQVNCAAMFTIRSNTQSRDVYLHPPDVDDEEADTTAARFTIQTGTVEQVSNGPVMIVTDTSSRLAARADGNTTVDLMTFGWRDFLDN